MELAAADVASLVGSVAALANDLFAKDDPGSSRTWTYSCHARRTRTHSCRLVQDALYMRFTNNLGLCTSEGRIG